MRPLLPLAAALALAACAAGRPGEAPPAGPTADPTREALARFQAAPDRLGLFVLDVAGGSLRDWAVVLQSLDDPGLEITFRPDRSAGAVPGAARGVETVARAAPAGRWRAARALAVQDGRPCATADAPPSADPPPLTRALYPATLPADAPTLALAPGQALYLGRLGIAADLLACAGPEIRLEATPGAPTRAARRLDAPLTPARPLLPPGNLRLRPR